MRRVSGRACYSTRPQVLLMDEVQLAKKDLERLSSHAEVLRNHTQSRDELIRAFSRVVRLRKCAACIDTLAEHARSVCRAALIRSW